MAPSPPDRRARGLLLVLALACALLPAQAQRAGSEKIDVNGTGGTWNLDRDSISLNKLTLRQGAGTLIVADKGTGIGSANNYADSRWEVNGAVKIEFDGMTLDADSANVVFVGGEVQSIAVKGGPARFSRPGKTAGRAYQGRASGIDYNAATTVVRFLGKTWWFDGVNEANAEDMEYNVRENEIRSSREQKIEMIFRNDRRVPAPRAPDRSSAP